MRWAMAHGFIENNPAGEAIDGALPPMPRVKDSLRALPYREVSEALKIVEAYRSSASARLCLRLTVLTAARSGEARGALWSEMDLDQALWTVPAAWMKGGLEHRVPLSKAAVDVLAKARELHDGSDLVFPSPRRPGQPLPDMTLTKVLRDTGLAQLATVHGFRSTFRNWGSDTEADSDSVLELALAHRPGNEVERAYARSDRLELRRPVMEAWGEFVTGGSGGVQKSWLGERQSLQDDQDGGRRNPSFSDGPYRYNHFPFWLTRRNGEGRTLRSSSTNPNPRGCRTTLAVTERAK